jgi:hypothetical protein
MKSFVILLVLYTLLVGSECGFENTDVKVLRESEEIEGLFLVVFYDENLSSAETKVIEETARALRGLIKVGVVNDEDL